VPRQDKTPGLLGVLGGLAALVALVLALVPQLHQTVPLPYRLLVQQ